MDIEWVRRSACEVGDEEPKVILHDLGAGGGARCVCQGCWEMVLLACPSEVQRLGELGDWH